MPAAELTNREARWLALAGQGLHRELSGSGARPGGTNALRSVMRRVGTIQLDAVNVLARTQLLVPFSRIGAFELAEFSRLCRPRGGWFEYWGHAASLLPLELHPLFRWKMQRSRADLVDGPTAQARRRAWRVEHAQYLAAVLAEVAERGPLTAGQLSDPRRRNGTWWDRRSDGRRALELLFCDGVLTAWRNSAFERVYELTERAIPRRVLDVVTPDEEEAQRQLLLLAARCLGVATLSDLAEYFWIRPVLARHLLEELVSAKLLEQVQVEGWRAPAYLLPDARPRRPRGQRARLLSPFDSLIWTRARAERLFGFHYRIGIYVPKELRSHGYYVLPLLVERRLVARLDLKADRARGVLQVLSAHDEPAVDRGEVGAAAIGALEELAAWLGLSRVLVRPVGALAPFLR